MVYFGWYELLVLETVVLRRFLYLQLVCEVSRVILLIVAIQLQIKTASLFSYKSSGFNQFLRGASLVLGVYFQQEDLIELKQEQEFIFLQLEVHTTSRSHIRRASLVSLGLS